MSQFFSRLSQRYELAHIIQPTVDYVIGNVSKDHKTTYITHFVSNAAKITVKTKRINSHEGAIRSAAICSKLTLKVQTIESISSLNFRNEINAF